MASKDSMMPVQLVNEHNHNVVLEKGEFKLNKGRIPIKDILALWKIKDPIWVDAEMEIGMTADGYSDFGFTSVKVVRIVAKPDRK